MSKAFTKEDSGDEEPLLREDDAALPEGVPNYVTPHGLAVLRQRLAELRAAVPKDPRARMENERRQRVLSRKLETAEIVDPRLQPVEEVRFGVLTTVRDDRGRQRTYQIVGVDEADARQGRISWLTPLAKALMGAVVGDVVTVASPRGDQELEVVQIRRG